MSRLSPLLAMFFLCLGPAGLASAQSGAGLYEATVPLSASTERGRAQAFEEAMRQVLAQATGRPGAGEEPALAPLVGEAARYVQQYRLLPGGLMFVGFDGRRIERLIAAADPSEVRELRIVVSGIGGVQAYAQVTAHLESLLPIRELLVESLGADTVTYRARVRGEVDKVAEAIASSAQLRPEFSAEAGVAGELSYRYWP